MRDAVVLERSSVLQAIGFLRQLEGDYRWRQGYAGLVEDIGLLIERFKYALEELEARCETGTTRIAELEGLLRIARCPDTDCYKGAIPHGPDPDGNWEAQQCQWCYERDAALDGNKGETP